MEMKNLAEFDVYSPEYYGFGPEIMKRIKVCTRCGAPEEASRYICRKCGAKLPPTTLFQRYQQMHRQCLVCSTILTAKMKFCPHCGVNLESNRKGD